MDLSTEEKAVIKRLAEGDQSAREQSIQIYRAFIQEFGRCNNLFINFVSEVDNKVPDLSLRARYREAICAYELPTEVMRLR
jgi:hypothetical protein